jgi:glycosyltransferase involved in cell wall biosynthesis
MTFDAPPPSRTGECQPEARAGDDHPDERGLRLLVVTYLFPPDSAVGARRWAGITKYLARAGWRIDVTSGGREGASPPVEGVRTHRIRRLVTLNDAYIRLSESRRPISGLVRGPPSGAGAGLPPDGPNLRRTLAYALQYPDYSRGWFLKAVVAVRRIVVGRRVDVVVSSGPPHTAHLAAMVGTAGSAVPWIMDMRDPWAEAVPERAPTLFKALTESLERRAFATCDGVVCNTREHADVLRRRGVQSVSWIPNGIDLEALPSPVPPQPGPLTIAHVGTLYVNRDLGPVIEAMDRLQSSRAGTIAAGVKLKIVGHAAERHEAALREQLSRSGLAHAQVERVGRVPPDVALDIVRRAHLCLVLAQAQPKQVPAKLYEAMGCGVQTLVLTEPGSASATEAERIGALWRDPSDVEGIVDVIRRLADGSLAARQPPPQAVDYQGIASEYGKLLRALVR